MKMVFFESGEKPVAVALVLVSAVSLTLLVIVDTVVPSAASRPEPQAADAVR